VNYSVDANSSASPRSGVITVGDQVFNVNQASGTTAQLVSMTMSNGAFRCRLNGQIGSSYVIQVSSDLVNWVNRYVKTIPAGGSAPVVEAFAGYGQRYYRAVTSNAGPFVVQPGPNDSQDVWTTSYYSYANCAGAGTGGGANDEKLRVGGWGDQYYSLLQFDLTDLPTNASSAVLYLYCFNQSGGGTTMYLDRVTSAWNWRTSGTGCDRLRLWWADRPSATAWGANPIPNAIMGQWYAVDITTLYNAWQNGTYPNYGVQFRPVNYSANNFNEFYSADYTGNLGLRPKLLIIR